MTPAGQGRRHQVAIYSPFASSYYDRDTPQGGGAEVQMTFLARELAARGRSVAHIVFPVADPVEIDQPGPTVHCREPYHGTQAGLNRFREAAAIWRSLKAVDASIYVVRGSASYVFAVAEFCRFKRRRMVFSAANDFDLSREPVYSPRTKHALYLHGLRAADTVVVQSDHQIGMARELLGDRMRIELIPSFSQPVAARVSEPDTFLWASRVVRHKQPLEFVRLAREMPEARFKMVLAGGYDTDLPLLERIRSQAAELENLELSGPLRREEVLGLLCHTTAIVSTSLWEGMPNVFLEAWARRVPVLSLAFDPDGRIAADGLGIAADGDWSAFVSGARSLWDDAALRESFGRNGEAYVAERHAPEVVATRWDEVLGLDSP